MRGMGGGARTTGTLLRHGPMARNIHRRLCECEMKLCCVQTLKVGCLVEN